MLDVTCAMSEETAVPTEEEHPLALVSLDELKQKRKSDGTNVATALSA